jgi:hypothetical protein
MQLSDRNTLLNLLRLNSIEKPFFISVKPSDASAETEQLYQMHGVLAESTKVLISRALNRYVSAIKIEEA